MIDLRRLQTLRAVAYYGTVAGAARALHVTASAASQQVRQLGRDLDVTLLEQHGRRVHLTLAARKLLEHADAIEERWREAQADLRTVDAEAPAGCVTLCGITTAISALFAPAVAVLTERWPAVSVAVREAEPPYSLDLLFSGEVDIVVTMATPDGPPLDNARFDQRPLLDEPFDLLTATAHPLAGRPDLTLADLASENWVLAPPHTAYRDTVLAVCTTAGYTPRVVHQVLEWTAVAALVGHGSSICLVPRLTRLPAHPPVTRTPLAAGAPRRRLLSITARGARNAPSIAAGLDVLHEIAERHNAPDGAAPTVTDGPAVTKDEDPPPFAKSTGFSFKYGES